MDLVMLVWQAGCNGIIGASEWIISSGTCPHGAVWAEKALVTVAPLYHLVIPIFVIAELCARFFVYGREYPCVWDHIVRIRHE
jgi:hypothetical protein